MLRVEELATEWLKKMRLNHFYELQLPVPLPQLVAFFERATTVLGQGLDDVLTALQTRNSAELGRVASRDAPGIAWILELIQCQEEKTVPTAVPARPPKRSFQAPETRELRGPEARQILERPGASKVSETRKRQEREVEAEQEPEEQKEQRAPKKPETEPCAKFNQLAGEPATPENIKRLFRTLALEKHPDKHPEEKARYDAEFDELKKAHARCDAHVNPAKTEQEKEAEEQELQGALVPVPRTPGT
jgi:hypothetical protein